MTLKILQWNAWIFEKKENVLNVVKELDPDIVCLQELTIDSTFQGNDNVIEYLAEELGYNQFHKQIKNLAPSDGVGDLANGILTKWPITSTSWQWLQQPQNGGLNYDDQYRAYVEAVIKVSEHELTVGTVHISYTHKFQDTPQRKQEVDNLIEIARNKSSSYVLTGDFNSLPNSYLVSNLQKYLVHAGPEFSNKTWTTKPFSYNGFEETDLNWRLDYVFTTRDVRCYHLVQFKQITQTTYLFL